MFGLCALQLHNEMKKMVAQWVKNAILDLGFPSPSIFPKIASTLTELWISKAGQRRNNAPFKKPSGKGKPRTKQPKKVKFISKYTNRSVSFEWRQRTAYMKCTYTCSVGSNWPFKILATIHNSVVKRTFQSRVIISRQTLDETSVLIFITKCICNS